VTLLELGILGIVIGSNNFAVALTLGALGLKSYRYRVMFVFGLFEFALPLAGILLGTAVAELIGFQANIVGALMLFGLGLFTVIGGTFDFNDDEYLARRIVSWSGLTVLGAGLSLDNLLVGLSLGFGKVQPLILAATISFFSVIFTWLGMLIGGETRRRLEREAKIASGVLLIFLGIALGIGWL